TESYYKGGNTESYYKNGYGYYGLDAVRADKGATIIGDSNYYGRESYGHGISGISNLGAGTILGNVSIDGQGTSVRVEQHSSNAKYIKDSYAIRNDGKIGGKIDAWNFDGTDTPSVWGDYRGNINITSGAKIIGGIINNNNAIIHGNIKVDNAYVDYQPVNGTLTTTQRAAIENRGTLKYVRITGAFDQNKILDKSVAKGYVANIQLSNANIKGNVKNTGSIEGNINAFNRTTILGDIVNTGTIGVYDRSRGYDVYLNTSPLVAGGGGVFKVNTGTIDVRNSKVGSIINTGRVYLIDVSELSNVGHIINKGKLDKGISVYHSNVGTIINTTETSEVAIGKTPYKASKTSVDTLNNSGKITGTVSIGTATLKNLQNTGVMNNIKIEQSTVVNIINEATGKISGQISASIASITSLKNEGNIAKIFLDRTTVKNFANTDKGIISGKLNLANSTITTLDNKGTIENLNVDSGAAISLLNNQGIIEGNQAIIVNGAITSLNNIGTIKGTNQGIGVGLGSINTITNTGNITGGIHALSVYGGKNFAIGLISNTGKTAKIDEITSQQRTIESITNDNGAVIGKITATNQATIGISNSAGTIGTIDSKSSTITKIYNEKGGIIDTINLNKSVLTASQNLWSAIRNNSGTINNINITDSTLHRMIYNHGDHTVASIGTIDVKNSTLGRTKDDSYVNGGILNQAKIKTVSIDNSTVHRINNDYSSRIDNLTIKNSTIVALFADKKEALVNDNNAVMGKISITGSKLDGIRNTGSIGTFEAQKTTITSISNIRDGSAGSINSIALKNNSTITEKIFNKGIIGTLDSQSSKISAIEVVGTQGTIDKIQNGPGGNIGTILAADSAKIGSIDNKEKIDTIIAKNKAVIENIKTNSHKPIREVLVSNNATINTLNNQGKITGGVTLSQNATINQLIGNGEFNALRLSGNSNIGTFMSDTYGRLNTLQSDSSTIGLI
ncbi:MAG: hypothetical protein K2I63_01700, partial [Helicobacter sp.]|nr:hypothetical protein [Helicobacter sp.]